MKKLSENPTIADQVLFELETPDGRGLKLVDPDVISKITIYFINRDCGATNNKLYKVKHYNPILLEKYNKLLEQKNMEAATHAKILLNASLVTSDYYFQEQTAVYTLENAWNKADPTKSILKQVVYNRKNQEQFGVFTLPWQPPPREGNYIIVWEWRIGDKTFNNHKLFVLGSEPKRNILHSSTVPGKYEMLFKRYTPNYLKYQMKKDDLTPDVLNKLQKCLAKGFETLENLGNQLISVYDANETAESLLPLLGNMFNLKLRGNDVALWRRQCKQAVPLFKKKGTLEGLEQALDQCGIRLVKISRLWQCRSEIYQTDMFSINNFAIGELTYQPFNPPEVSVKTKDGYIVVPKESYVLEGRTLIWQDEKIKLFKGDNVKVEYQVKEVPESRLGVEAYIKSLPLASDRNWNNKLIAGDDPFFDVVIPMRHPFCEPVVFGRTRTSFLYSEKLFNTETYDGSLKESHDPKDFDYTFVDTCTSCLTSQFDIDVETSAVDAAEIKEIVREFVPFHAIIRQVNITGVIDDFVPIIENVEMYDDLFDGDKIEISEEISWSDEKEQK